MTGHHPEYRKGFAAARERAEEAEAILTWRRTAEKLQEQLTAATERADALERECNATKQAMRGLAEMMRSIRRNAPQTLALSIIADAGDAMTLGNDHVAKLEAEVAQLREELEDALTQPGDIHTCSPTCSRPMCVLRRERDELRELVTGMDDGGRVAAQRVVELEGKVTRLRSAVLWACGANGEFRCRKDGEGAYWWRKELRERAGITSEKLNRAALESQP